MAYIDDFEMREELDEMTLEELQEYREKQGVVRYGYSNRKPLKFQGY